MDAEVLVVNSAELLVEQGEDALLVSQEVELEVLVENGAEVLVDPVEEIVVVEVAAQGPPGPPGPQGIPGSVTGGVLYYRQEFLSPSTTWTVNHNLGASPDVAVHSVGGAKVIASVTHTSVNQAVVSFESPFSGFVVCS